MTCLQFKMSDTAILTFHAYASTAETRVVVSKGPSSSSAITPTTNCTLSTIAPTTATPADVKECEKVSNKIWNGPSNSSTMNYNRTSISDKESTYRHQSTQTDITTIRNRLILIPQLSARGLAAGVKTAQKAVPGVVLRKSPPLGDQVSDTLVSSSSESNNENASQLPDSANIDRSFGEEFIRAFSTSSGGEESDNEGVTLNGPDDLSEFIRMKPSSQNQLQATIDLVEKEQCNEIGAETQALVENLEEEAEVRVVKKVNAKRRRNSSASKKASPVAKKVPKTLPDPQAESFLGVLELIWAPNVYNQVMEKLKFGEQRAMQEKNLLLKRDNSYCKYLDVK